MSNLNGFDWSIEGLKNAGHEVAEFFAAYSDAIALGAGAVVTLVLVRAFRVAIQKKENRAKRVANFSAVITMVWTSEGLLNTAITDWGVPWQIAAIGFCVFEAMLVAAWLTAEENRKEYGSPGSAGLYAFLIATVQGAVAASGAGTFGEVFMRLALPPLAVGLAWVLLARPRPTDKEEWKEARAQAAAEREATWVWTPTTILVRWGIRHPGKVTVTEAQRRHRIERMVELVDTIETAAGRRGDRVKAKARRKLRTLVRACEPADLAEVALRADRASNFELLLLPSKANERATSDVRRLLQGEPPLAEWSRRYGPPKPPAAGRIDVDTATTYTDDTDDTDSVPVSPAPAGVPVIEDVDPEWFDRHSERISLVQRVTGEGWWNGTKPLSVDFVQGVGKERKANGEGLANRTNAKETAACLRRLRALRIADEVNGTNAAAERAGGPTTPTSAPAEPEGE